MILHLLPEEKFIVNFVKSVEEYGQENNRFIIRNGSKKLIHNRLEYISLRDPQITKLVSNLTKDDSLIIHFLDYDISKWLFSIKTDAKLHWVFYGGEFYKLLNHINPNFNLFDPKTQGVFEDQKVIQNNLKRIVLRRIKSIYNNNRFKNLNKYFRQIIPRFDSVYHFNDEDINLIKSSFDSGLKSKVFFYTNFTNFIKTHEPSKGSFTPIKIDESKINILLGNSASYENNHIDIFDKIPVDKSVVVYATLSYGKEAYRAFVIKEGRKKFGSNFIPITEFYSYSEYFQLLSKMNASIMGHNRSQGLGNILIQLYQGKYLFLKPNNPAYKWLINIGLNINIIDNINISILQNGISLEEQKMNKEILINYFGEQRLKEIYSSLF